MDALRKLIAIALLAVLALPLAPQMLAMTASSGSNLPACCRRNGAHHCAMTANGEQHAPAFSSPLARCPYCPAAIGSNLHSDSVILSGYALAWITHGSTIDASSRAQNYSHFLRDYTRPLRGPPPFATPAI